MKPSVRFALATAAVGAGLFLSGCTTTVSQAPQPKPLVEFTVVESSTQQELTPAQLDELRESVIAYLRDNGLTGNRVYLVKVNFATANPDELPQWVIVRIGNISARTFQVLAAYPGADDSYPYDHYRLGYYSPGHYGISRYGYNDPYYYDSGKYLPPVPPRVHPQPDDRNDKPDHPPTPRTRWDRTPRTGSDQPGRHHPPRTENPEHRGRNRADDGDHKRYADKDLSSASGNTPPRPAQDSSSSPTYAPPPANANSGTQREASSNAGIQQPAATEKEK